MPITGASIALVAAPAIQQFIAAGKQKRLANKVRVRDSQTPQEAESLALGRQAAYAQMPGMGTAQNQLNQTFADSASQLAQGAVSAGGYLGGLGRLDANRGAGSVALNDQTARFRVGQMGMLQNLLARRGAQQRGDQERAAAERAALTEASNRNLQGGFSTLSQAGVYGLKGLSSAGAAPPPSTSTRITGLTPATYASPRIPRTYPYR